MTERNFSVVDDATLGTGIVNEHEHEDDLVPEVPHVGPTTVGRDQGEREATKGTTPLFPILGLCSYGRNSGGHHLQLRPLS